MGQYLVTEIIDKPCASCAGKGRHPYMTNSTPIGPKLPTKTCESCNGTGNETRQVNLIDALKAIKEQTSV